jgi:hypothetical protein
MRRLLEAISIAVLAGILLSTAALLYGVRPLTSAIPTHFGPDGRATAWGPPDTLLIFPGIVVSAYLLLSLAGTLRQRFRNHTPSDPQMSQRRHELVLDLLAWLKLEVTVFVVVAEVATVHITRHPAAMFNYRPLIAGLAVIGFTICAYALVMLRSGKART